MRKEPSVDDLKIISLLENRDQDALKLLGQKYGSYCAKISHNILCDSCDSEENVNDTYMQVWNSIPPQKPGNLMAFVGRLARNLALNKLKAKNAEKRNPAEGLLSLSELDDCTPDGLDVEKEADIKALSRHISDFLRTQKEEARNIFIRRYFYCDSTEDIALLFSCSTSKVKSSLMRTREKLRLYLLKEGYTI